MLVKIDVGAGEKLTDIGARVCGLLLLVLVKNRCRSRSEMNRHWCVCVYSTPPCAGKK